MANAYMMNKNLINKLIKSLQQASAKCAHRVLDSDFVLYCHVTLDNDYLYSTWRVDIKETIIGFDIFSKDDLVYICAKFDYKISEILSIDSIYEVDSPIPKDDAFSAIYGLLFNDRMRWKTDNIRRAEPILDKATKSDVDISPQIILNSDAYRNMKDGISKLKAISPESKLADKLYPKLSLRTNSAPVLIVDTQSMMVDHVAYLSNGNRDKLNPPSIRSKVYIESMFRSPNLLKVSIEYLPIHKWLGFKIFESGVTEVDKTYKAVISAPELRR